MNRLLNSFSSSFIFLTPLLISFLAAHPRTAAGQVPAPCQVEICDFDDCGVCRGGNKDKGCDGVCFSGNVVDGCGVCDGHNWDKGCDGVCFSGKVPDCLNQCGGSAVDAGCGCGQPAPGACGCSPCSPPPACVHVDAVSPHGSLGFLFGDGKGGNSDLNGSFAASCSNGSLQGLQTVVSGVGVAGNLKNPSYTLNVGLSYPGNLSLTTWSKSTGTSSVGVKNLALHQDITPTGTPGNYTVHIYGTFKATSPVHGDNSGPENFIDIWGTVSCC